MKTFRLEVGSLVGAPEYSEDLVANDVDEAVWIANALARPKAWSAATRTIKLTELNLDGRQLSWFVSREEFWNA